MPPWKGRSLPRAKNRLASGSWSWRTALPLGHCAGVLLSSNGWKATDDVLLVTMGSPARRFFERFFPDFIFPGAPCQAAGHVAARLAEFRWINVYRPFDQIGSSLRLSAQSGACDRSTKQWNLFLSAHVGYWNDPAVIAIIAECATNLEKVPRTVLLPANAPPATQSATGFNVPSASLFKVMVLLILGSFIWLCVSLLKSADDVDQRLRAEQAFFQSSDQVRAAPATAQRLPGSEIVEGRRVPVVRTHIYFKPADRGQVMVLPRTLGSFYRRDVFDIDALKDQVEANCKGLANCPPLPIEVTLRSEPRRYSSLDLP